MSKIELVIESCYDNIDLIGTCVESISSQIFNDQQCHQIKVSVYEAVTNCIKHGYQDSPNHKVYVTYQIDNDRIALDIVDSGIAMNPQVLQEVSTAFQIDPENISEGGMGLKIIKLFMDDCNYYSKDGMNHFTLVKYSKPPPGAFVELI